MAQSDWTEDRLALLKSLCAEKLTCAKIAERINFETGSSFSRNACIGKITRSGFDQSFKSISGRPKTKRVRVGNIDVNIMRRLKAVRGPDLPQETPQPVEFLGLTFGQLDNSRKQCRYPRGETPYLFCGQPVQEGSSYCPTCHRIAYHKLTPYARTPYIPARSYG